MAIPIAWTVFSVVRLVVALVNEGFDELGPILSVWLFWTVVILATRGL
jgi:hypothetical protein